MCSLENTANAQFTADKISYYLHISSLILVFHSVGFFCQSIPSVKRHSVSNIMNLERTRMEIKSQIKSLGIIGKKVISHIPELTKVIIFIFIVEIVYYQR